jgi:uncharacterized protein (DUF3820 family)
MKPTTHVLPFGKHKGQELSSVPTDYLRWCLGNCKLSSGFRVAVVAELHALGVELASDGKTVWLRGDDWRKVPPDLIRQQGHLLATMIGDNRGADVPRPINTSERRS